MEQIAIETKGKVKQLLCRHDYVEGVISQPYFNLNGTTYTTICTKCGKIKYTRFVRNFDGS